MNSTAKVEEMKETEVAEENRRGEKESDKLGMTVTNLDESTARQLNLQNAQGVLIADVEVNSVADKAGFQRGDVILEVNRNRVNDVSQFRDLVRKTSPGSSLLFLINRSGGTMFIAVSIPQQ